MKRLATLLAPIALAAVTGQAATPAAKSATSGAATAQPLPGKPNLLIAAYDIGQLGYRMDEYLISGTATSYKLPGPPTADGMWDATAAATAPYVSRIVALRPTDPAKFNGTVIVEWLNVTAGQDTPADWMVAHREMVRSGYAYVGVTAQKAGVDPGGSIMGMGNPLKKADPKRYTALDHPGDAFSYDIFSQAGALLKQPEAGGVLGGLRPRHVIAIGESQSAAFLTTYVNAVDPIARVYDGFLIHSRFGNGSALDGTRRTSSSASTGDMPPGVRFRAPLRVPLMTVITETDVAGGRLPGYSAARQPDNDRLRVWEVAGTAHADSYLFGGAFIDSGLQGSAALARVFAPTANSPMGKLAKPVNPGMPHHYVTMAALAALDRWVATGKAPPHGRPLAFAGGTPPAYDLDANGLARGGVRTPWTDVPTVKLSGIPSDGSNLVAALVGSGEPLDAAALKRLYPGGRADYLKKFTAALDRSIRAGFILAADRQEILDIAAANYPAAG